MTTLNKPIISPHDIDMDFYESDEYKASISLIDPSVPLTFEEKIATEKIRQDISQSRIQSVMKRINDQRKTTISLRLKTESISKIKSFAKAQGIPYQTLLNAYIDEIADSLPPIQ